MTATMSAMKRTLANSPLVKQGGFAVTQVFTAAELAGLRSEAHRQHTSLGTETRLDTPAAEQPERGNPPCWFESAPGGPALHRAAHSKRILDTLRHLTACRCEPLGPQGSYSFYRRPGHHFGAHRDIDHCDIAAITCIELTGQGGGGELIVFPQAATRPIRSAAAGVGVGHRLRIEYGQTVVLLGGHIPHLVTPIEGSVVRVVAPLCYRITSLSHHFAGSV